MKMSKKFNDAMAVGYTIVFALGFSILTSLFLPLIGLMEFDFWIMVYEAIYAVAIATLFTMLIPVFSIADAFARLCKATAPSRKYILCVSSVACSIYVPIICFFMMLLHNYPNFSLSVIFMIWIRFVGPFFVTGLLLAQIFGKLIFKIVINKLGDEAIEQPAAAPAVKAAPTAAEESDTLDLENGQPFSGKWSVVTVSPAGKNTIEFNVCQRGEKLDGFVLSSDVECPISEGKVEGDQFFFKVSLKLPFGLLPFEVYGTFDDKTLKGETKMVQNGYISPMDGARVSGAPATQSAAAAAAAVQEEKTEVREKTEIVFDYDKCIGCRICYNACFADVIGWDKENNRPVCANPEECAVCTYCEIRCPKGCIDVRPYYGTPQPVMFPKSVYPNSYETE